MRKFFKEMKESYYSRKKELEDHQYIKIYNQIFIHQHWPLIVKMNNIISPYIILRLIIILIIQLLNNNHYLTVLVFIFFEIIVLLIPNLINYLIKNRKISKKRQIQTMNIIISILCIYLVSKNIFYLQDQIVNTNQDTFLLGFLLCLQLLFYILTLRLWTVKIIILAIFFFFAIFSTSGTSIFVYELTIWILITYFMYQWQIDSLYIQISKLKMLQKSILLNMPNALCVLNNKANKILFFNNQFRQLTQKKTFIGDRPIKQRKMSSNYLEKSQNIQEATVNGFNEGFQFFEQLYIEQVEVYSQLKMDFENDLQENDNQSKGYIDLNCVIKYISELKDKQGELYQFRCQIIELDEDENENRSHTMYKFKNKIILDVRIKTGMNYAQSKAIFITLHDISTQLESIYYQKMNVFKNQLIKSISHELRTRLNIIQGMIQMVQNQSDYLNQECTSLLKTAYNNCRIQAYIIGSIIDYNLIQDDQVELKIDRCRIKQVIRESIQLFNEEAELKQLNIQFEQNFETGSQQEQFMQIDKEKLMSILVHLILNSIKFTNGKGMISVSVTQEGCPKEQFSQKKQPQLYSLSKISGSENSEYRSKYLKYNSKNSVFSMKNINTIRQTFQGDFTKITITDTGIGINEEKLATLQKIIKQDDEDYQEDQSDKSQGFNLGLKVVTQLLNFINQQCRQWVFIESVPKIGTTVRIYVKPFMVKNTFIEVQNMVQSESLESEGSILKINQMRNTLTQTVNYLAIKEEEMSIYSEKQSVKQQFTCQKEILIVDDEPYNLLVLESLFKQLKQPVVKAYNGQHCIDIINERLESSNQISECGVFKAIFMDYQMPILNGEVATKRLIDKFQRCNIAPIPIFGCTGFSAKEDIKALLDAGMQEVFIKPITKQLIEDILVRIDIGEFRKNILSSPRLEYMNIEREDEQLIE